jgi:hypothetical protein
MLFLQSKNAERRNLKGSYKDGKNVTFPEVCMESISTGDRLYFHLQTGHRLIFRALAPPVCPRYLDRLKLEFSVRLRWLGEELRTMKAWVLISTQK